MSNERQVSLFEHKGHGIRYSENAPENTASLVRHHADNIKHQAFEVAPAYEAATNQQLDNFFHRFGLNTAPVALASPNEVLQLYEQLTDVGLQDEHIRQLGVESSGSSAESIQALYLPTPDIIIGVRWPDLLNNEKGEEYFLYLLAHEKAHSSSQFNRFVVERTSDTQLSYRVPRTGHAVQTDGGRYGEFLEEGFADFMAAEFVRNELNLPNGAWDHDYPVSMGEYPPLPGVYTWPTRTGGVVSTGAYAAYGLELYSSLIDARQTVDGLRKVAKIIEDVETGLYAKLMKLPRTQKDFAQGLENIQQALDR